VAEAVERRYYPGLPQPYPAPLSQQIWDGIALGIRVLVLQVLGLVLAIFIPGVGALAGWAVTAWAVGRGLFVAVAMRRMDRRDAMALYDSCRLTVTILGALIAAASLVPGVNLMIPVLGTAAMVHVFHAPLRSFRELNRPAG
jgi:CysZ protein